MHIHVPKAKVSPCSTGGLDRALPKNQWSFLWLGKNVALKTDEPVVELGKRCTITVGVFLFPLTALLILASPLRKAQK